MTTKRPQFLEALTALGVGAESLDETLDEAPFGVLIDHVEDGCIYASDTVLRMFEMSWEALRGFGWMAAVVPGDMDALRGTFERYQRDKQPIEVRYRIKTSGGEIHPIVSFANPILDSTGKQLGSVIVGRRAPERVLAERGLQAQKLEAIGRLAGRVAHDFNNILTPILCAASLLTDESLSEGGAEMLSTIQQGVEHAGALTEQLLGLSKQSNQGSHASTLDDEIGKLRPMLEKLVGERISLSFALDCAEARVGLAPHELGQVLLNLCINGRDAVSGVGSIEIRTGFDGAFAELTVSDSGPGIPLDVQQRMFEPFFTTKADRGTGLGLSSVRDLVRRAGGDVTVRSELGRGTRMRVTLPTVSARGKTSPAEPRGQASRQIEPQRILLVDDNDALRQTVAYVLAMRGHHVVTSATVARAAALLDEQAFDVLVTDVLLPDGRGDELGLRAPAELHVVYMSGFTGEEFDPRKRRDSDAVFLHKPFRPEDVLDAVATAVSSRRSDAG